MMCGPALLWPGMNRGPLRCPLVVVLLLLLVLLSISGWLPCTPQEDGMGMPAAEEGVTCCKCVGRKGRQLRAGEGS